MTARIDKPCRVEGPSGPESHPMRTGPEPEPADAIAGGMSAHESEPPCRYSDSPSLPASQRAAIFGGVLLLQALLVLAVMRGLAAAGIVPAEGPGTAAIAVPLDPPAPPPSPSPSASRTAREEQGAEGAAGQKARATQIVAARARIPTSPVAAAPAASTGNAMRSGASQGEGTGGGAQGTGTGAGGSGNGSGGRYAAQRAVKIAGDITSARDYPKKGREQRLGKAVVVWLTVGTDGRVSGCRVGRASGDPEADAITCRLAVERFRFRPALDQTGQPIESTFGWEQRWYDPRSANAK